MGSEAQILFYTLTSFNIGSAYEASLVWQQVQRAWHLQFCVWMKGILEEEKTHLHEGSIVCFQDASQEKRKQLGDK